MQRVVRGGESPVFGVVRPCRHVLCGSLFRDWTAHLCGLCLTLRAEHGQAARLVTDYDGRYARRPVAAAAGRMADCDCCDGCRRDCS
jgi:hypothetical protein